jgi:beta-lactamase regulating signal transducer with metallopeptidase domain
MNPPSLLASPVFIVLFKWTCLLALGWLAHWALRRRHARWRLALWRSMLCFGLVLPLTQFLEIPGIKIPINTEKTSSTELAGPFPSAALAVQTTPPANLVTQPSKIPGASSPAAISGNSLPPQAPTKPIPWGIILTVVWALGCACGIARLTWLHLQLSRLQKASNQPTADLQLVATRIQARLDVHQTVAVRISETVSSPFVCGLLKPMIIIPRLLEQQLSPAELSALLSHEIAHLRRHDLFWCVAWRWLQAVCWFHPLIWNVPAAHNLACEQEADRLASGQLAEHDSYSRMLARLALRVLALPAVETSLTLNGSSQIARRLDHLGRKGRGNWNWLHSTAAFSLAGLLFLLTAGCQLSKSDSSDSQTPATVEFKKVLVVVQGEDGKPVEGATILPDGFRVKGIHSPDAYPWNQQLFGPPEKAITDRDGKAYVKYPVEGIPEEKEFTGKIIFSVSHPAFSTVRPQEYSVDAPEQPIHLTHGIHLELTGYVGNDRVPVADLVPNLNEEIIKPEDWQKGDNGVYAFQKLSPGGHLIQLMGRLPSGEIVFSKSFAFTAEKGGKYNFSLEMRPGIRLEGRLDDRVPRPVKNGRVVISVRPDEYPAWNNYADVDHVLKQYPNVHFWKSFRPIAEDGTFVFESVPPGGLDVVVHGDGFVSQNGADFLHHEGSKLVKGPSIAMPQAFFLEAPTTKIEVLTEPTATLKFTAKARRSGKPIEGATVYVNPNVLRINGIFGNVRYSNEEPFRTVAPLPDIPYHAKTDKDGVATVRNIPASTRGMEVDHPHYQVPLQEPEGWRDRHIPMSFSPGVTNKIELSLEPKGTDFIGSTR